MPFGGKSKFWFQVFGDYKKIEPYNSEVRWRVDDVLLSGVHWTVENIFFLFFYRAL